MKILMVGGTWNKENGKESGLINKMYQELKKLTKDITFYNGGKYENLEKIIDSARNCYQSAGSHCRRMGSIDHDSCV